MPPGDEEATRAARHPEPNRMRFAMARLLVIGGPDDGASVAIGPGGIVVGSGASCDLELEDPLVSRRHLAVRREADGLRIEDLGSRNGTFVGDLRVRDVSVTSSISLRAGDTALRLELAGEQEVELHPDVRFGAAIGVSREMRHVFSLLAQAAKRSVTVLLEGDSGTGKDVLANALHAESERREGPFVVLDCSAIPRELVESELFGHEKGAFTGAQTTRRGAFEEADGGTLFLDEIGELPLDLQPKLLRALENRSFRRVGSSVTTKVDVRVVAATNRRLHEAVRRREFREDLFYRLGVVHVLVPPLSARPADIRPLAEQFLRRATDDPSATIPADLMRLLEAYTWPGNARELRNVVERFATFGGADPGALFGRAGATPEGSASSLFDGPGAGPVTSQPADGRGVDGLKVEGLAALPYHEAKSRLLDAFHREVLPRVVEQEAGNVSRAADRLGIPRTSLHRMLQKMRDEG